MKFIVDALFCTVVIAILIALGTVAVALLGPFVLLAAMFVLPWMAVRKLCGH